MNDSSVALQVPEVQGNYLAGGADEFRKVLVPVGKTTINGGQLGVSSAHLRRPCLGGRSNSSRTCAYNTHGGPQDAKALSAGFGHEHFILLFGKSKQPSPPGRIARH